MTDSNSTLDDEVDDYESAPEETAYMEEHYPSAMTVIGPSFDPDGPGYERASLRYGLGAGTIECPICGDVERCPGCERRCTCECICDD